MKRLRLKPGQRSAFRLGGGYFRGLLFKLFSSRSGLSRSPAKTLFSGLIIFITSFLFTSLVSHFTKPTFNSEALIDPSSYHINISSVAKLGMKLETTPDGVMGSVKDTVNIKTNIPSGFKLFLSTNSDNTNSNRLNKDGSLSASHFVSASTGTVTAPKALTMNTWGFAIKKDSSNSFSSAFDDNYPTPYPSETSKWAGVGIKTAPNAILSTSSANDTSGVNLDVYYSLRVNMSLPKGSYRSEVVYTALANLSSISGATVSSGYELEVNPAQTNNLSGGETITIKTSLFGKNGITTTGSGGSTTAQNPDLGTITATIGGSACTGLNSSLSSGILAITCKTPAKTVGKYEVKVSIPKHSITISKANAFEYKPSQTTFNSITAMQEMTTQICANETTPTPSATTSTREHSTNTNLVPEAELKDIRDNKTYIIRKLADGRCWMVQNLDLDLLTGTALASSTSDVSSNWTPNNNTQTSTGTTWSPYTQDNQARSYNPGDKYLTGTGSSTQSVSSSGPKTAHVGNLYNWYAATAGSGAYSMSTSGQTASYSICPKGWKLPYGNNSQSYTTDSGDFRKLTNTYGITSGSSTGNSDSRLLSAPLNFVRSGYYSYNNGSYNNQGSNGYFWSSSVYNQDDAHVLDFYSSYVYPQNYHSKGLGFSVRCVAREDNHTTFSGIKTMQEMTFQICNSETTPYVYQNGATSGEIVGTTTRTRSTNKNLVPEAELKDTRDGKTYVVRKLADGKCWMVQNLDLDLSTGTALTSSTSDVSSSWTPNNSTQNSAGTSWGQYNNPTNQARSYNPGEQYLTGAGSANQTVSSSGPKTAHVGNLYNWYASTAGSGTYSMSTPGQTAPYSICPKGWKLPYGNNSQSQTENYGDFRKLTNTYGITSGANYTNNNVTLADKLISAPLSFVRSGFYRYSNGSYDYQGLYGYFWSSSVYDQDFVHYLHFISSYVNPQYNDSKGLGFSVRCLAR